MINSPKPPPFLHSNTGPCNGSPTTAYVMVIIDTDRLSLPGPRNSWLWLSIHPLAGIWLLIWLCLFAYSKVIQGVQQSTCKVYGHAQQTFLQFCHYYGLLPVPTDQEMLLYFATFLDDARGLQHGTIVGYVYRVWMLHIDMGLLNPLKGALWLHKCFQAIHVQSNPKPHKLAFTYHLLVLAHPLHQFPAQQVLWAALTMVHFELLQTGEFTVDQECFDPTCHLCIQDMSNSITTQSTLQYDTVHLKSSKTDPLDKVSMWSLAALVPTSVVSVPHGTLCRPIRHTGPPQQHPSSNYMAKHSPGHHGESHKRPVDQIRSQPFPL